MKSVERKFGFGREDSDFKFDYFQRSCRSCANVFITPWNIFLKSDVKTEKYSHESHEGRYISETLIRIVFKINRGWQISGELSYYVMH